MLSPDGSFAMTASYSNTYFQPLGAADLPSTTAPDAPSFSSPPTIMDTTTIHVEYTLGSNGGSPLTDLQYAREADYTTWTSIPDLPSTIDGTSSINITGLTAPVTGNYKLRAVNTVGPSAASAAGLVEATAPDAPSFSSPPTIVSNTSIDIVFSLGSNGGSDLTDLQYAREGDSYTTWTSIGLSLPLEGQTTATITGLTAPVTGNYKLRAVNAVDPSAASAAGLVEAIAPAAPSFTSPPTIAGSTSISIVFSLGFNGGSALTDLQYAREEDSYTTWTSIGLSLPLEGQTTATITGLTAPVTGNYKLRAVNAVDPSVASAAGLVSGTVPCFLEGSKILCKVDGVETYVAVETIRPGTLVKTSLNGFQPVKLIGSRVMVNAGGDTRDKNSLYLCTKANYPELTEDLVITGCHAILVDHITDVHRQGIIDTLERVFVTDKKYRLPACVDERAPVYQNAGTFTVWHFALEHTDIKMNYGVYAHGLLVESSPIWHMNTKNYKLVQ
jgi:hydrogenase/urease accessory protein HupE